MGNIIGTFLSSFVKVIGNLFGAPLDFLSGKSCSSVCGSTWDVVCYIEKFCISNLLKLGTVLALFYIVLLFFYLLHKIGICHCLGKSLCKMCWACTTSCFLCCENVFMVLWLKMKRLKKRRRERRINYGDDDDDDYDYTSSSSSDNDLEGRMSYYGHGMESMKLKRLHSDRTGERKRAHLERSLRPRHHSIRVGINVKETNGRRCNRSDVHHNIKVTQTSKFVQKGGVSKRNHRRRRSMI